MNELEAREDLGATIYGWQDSLGRIGLAVTALLLADVWQEGLKAAGTNAHRAKAWSAGKTYPSELPFVIEFQCPHGHRTDDRRRIASVRVLVEDDGWVSVDLYNDDTAEGKSKRQALAQCTHCGPSVVTKWLVTCPGCANGDEHYEHPSELKSPLAYVVSAMIARASMAEARWWLDNPEEARAEYALAVRRNSGWFEGSDEERERHVERMVEAKETWALRRLEIDLTPVPARALWTDESAAEWLDQQTDRDGGVLVPNTASQRQAWTAVEKIPGRPPKNRVEAAQTLRKARP
jgi:hypothetical protein